MVDITADVLAKLQSVRRSGKGWIARCPTHDDRTPSLSVDVSADGKPLFYCHANAGCTHHGISATLGLAAHNGNGHKQPHIAPQRNRTSKNVTPFVEVARYDYHEESNTLLYQVVRKEASDENGEKVKQFLQRRPDGAGGWIWSLGDVRRVLYRLPELLKSEPHITIFIVEGEKDADRLAEAGLTTTTNAGGAKAAWLDEYNEALRGYHVCILPDHDKPGVERTRKIAHSLRDVAASVRIVDPFVHEPLPEKHGKDVSDWLDAGGTFEGLEALVKAAPEWKPTLDTKQTRAHTILRFTFSTLDELLAEPEEETAYVWERTLPRGGFSICAAKPKVGKSTLARNLAVAVMRGAEFFGRATMKGKVIYLCLEEKRAEIAEHFRQMNACGSDLLIYTGRTPADALEALEAAIDEVSPVLVIIDPLSRFVRVADFNAYGEVTYALEPLIDLARESKCQCHILACHHNTKQERDGGDDLLGSTGFFGAVDTLLKMKRCREARTLESRQRYGVDMPETVVHLDTTTGIVTPNGDLQTVLLAERKQSVLDCLSGDELLTEADIKERIGGNQVHTAKAIRVLYEADMLHRTGAGKRGEPYRYAKRDETTGHASAGHDDSHFSLFSHFADIEKLEKRETEWMADCSDEAREHAALLEKNECPPAEAERLSRELFLLDN